MLKLTVRPGEYLMVGENIKIIFTGGSSNNIHIMVEAPKDVPVVRSSAAVKAGEADKVSYYKDKPFWEKESKKTASSKQDSQQSTGFPKSI